MSVSVVISALNEEKNIKRCLESVKWADEIIVLDAGSTDKTPDIASNYADIIVRSENMLCATGNYIGCNISNSDWILIMDADNEVPDNLKNEIIKSIKSDEYDGFRIPVKEFFYCGVSFIVGTSLRLVRRNKAEFPLATHHYASNWKVKGKTTVLNNYFCHYRNQKSVSSIENMISKVNKYSSDIAEEKFNDGVTFSKKRMIKKPLFRFYSCFFKKGYWKMGVFGLFLSLNNAYSKFVEEVKLWEYEMRENR